MLFVYSILSVVSVPLPLIWWDPIQDANRKKNGLACALKAVFQYKHMWEIFQKWLFSRETIWHIMVYQGSFRFLWTRISWHIPWYVVSASTQVQVLACTFPPAKNIVLLPLEIIKSHWECVWSGDFMLSGLLVCRFLSFHNQALSCTSFVSLYFSFLRVFLLLWDYRGKPCGPEAGAGLQVCSIWGPKAVQPMPWLPLDVSVHVLS